MNYIFHMIKFTNMHWEIRMNKAGSVFLKVLAIIGIILLVVLIIVGITIYQAVSVVSVVKAESVNIKENSQLLIEQRDCSRLDAIETSLNKIENKFSSACGNPILSFAVKQANQVPIKCDTLPQFKSDFEKQFNVAKTYCDSAGKINESIVNGSMSKEELLALAQKYGIQI